MPPFSGCLLIGEKPALNALTYNILNVGPQRQCMAELGQVVMSIYSMHKMIDDQCMAAEFRQVVC